MKSIKLRFFWYHSLVSLIMARIFDQFGHKGSSPSPHLWREYGIYICLAHSCSVSRKFNFVLPFPRVQAVESGQNVMARPHSNFLICLTFYIIPLFLVFSLVKLLERAYDWNFSKRPIFHDIGELRCNELSFFRHIVNCCLLQLLRK